MHYIVFCMAVNLLHTHKIIIRFELSNFWMESNSIVKKQKWKKTKNKQIYNNRDSSAQFSLTFWRTPQQDRFLFRIFLHTTICKVIWNMKKQLEITIIVLGDWTMDIQFWAKYYAHTQHTHTHTHTIWIELERKKKLRRIILQYDGRKSIKNMKNKNGTKYRFY